MKQLFLQKKRTRDTSETNELTQRIITGLFSIGVFAYRQNTLAVPVQRDGAVVGFRPPPVVGLPDIDAVVPAGLTSRWPRGGGSLGLEVKTGADKIRASQTSFHQNASHCGKVILVVHDWPDFLQQIFKVFELLSDEDRHRLSA